MLNTLNSIKVILISYGILFVANGLFTTFISVRAGLESFSILQIGWMMSSYFVGLLLSSLVAPYFLPKFGFCRSFIIFSLTIAIASLLFQAFLHAPMWVVLRFIVGFCIGTLIVITESWINSSSDNTVRGRILSIYMLVNNAAIATGQVLFSFSDPTGFDIFVLVSILLIGSAFPLLLSHPKEPALPELNNISVVAVIKRVPVGMAAALIAGCANASLFSLGPIYAESLQLSFANVGFFMACATAGGLALQWQLGKLSDLKDRRYMLFVSAFGSSVMCAALVLLPNHGLQLLLVLAFLYGAMSMTLSPLASAYVNDQYGGAKASKISGAILLVYGLGAVSGPILSSWVMNHLGGKGLFVSSGTLFFAYALVVLFGIIRKPQFSAMSARKEG